jgi:hypothetical protein
MGSNRDPTKALVPIRATVIGIADTPSPNSSDLGRARILRQTASPLAVRLFTLDARTMMTIKVTKQRNTRKATGLCRSEPMQILVTPIASSKSRGATAIHAIRRLCAEFISRSAFSRRSRVASKPEVRERRTSRRLDSRSLGML